MSQPDGDIALVWDQSKYAADFVVAANDLQTDGGLRTAILLSLFTDRRAELTDVLPTGETDRRGWWADEFADVPGDLFGSRLWLLSRSKRTNDVLDRAQTYATEALQWLIEDKVATAVSVIASFPAEYFGINLVVKLTRPGSKDAAVYRFGRAWAVEEARI